MDSSSDSDSNQLYTRAAENVRLKRNQFTAKLEDFVDLTSLNDKDDSFEKLDSRSFMDMALSLNKEELVVNNDTDSQVVVEIPAAVRPHRQLRSDSGPQNKLPEKCHVDSETTDSELDEWPLAVRLKINARSNSRPQRNSKWAWETNARPTKKQARPSKKRARRTHIPLKGNVAHRPSVISHNVIVLDDDSDFADLSPIQFMSPSASRKLREQLNKDVDNISLSDVIVDDDDEPVIITIEWSSTKTLSRKQFELRRYQKFETIFEELAKIENLPISRISLVRNFKDVTPKDTPDCLNLKYYAAMTGSISPYEIDYDELALSSSVDTKENLEGSIKVKLTLESGKTFQFTIMKHQKMAVLYKKCCEELNCKESLIKLTFDGDYVEPQDLLTSLDVEDGDVFDVFIKNESSVNFSNTKK